MRGTLFTQDFLERGVAETPQWRNLDDGAFRAFQEAVVETYRRIQANSTINEATTESEIIFPVIEALGWTDCLPQQTASRSGREDVPDALLFPNAEAKAAALKKRRDEARYPYGLAILESKRWRRALDRGEGADADYTGTPSTQILRYLSRAEIASERAIQWGLLTNGRYWRLYWQGSKSRAEHFLDLDLAVMAGMRNLQPDLFAPDTQRPDHYLKVFYVFYRREAFLPQADDSAGRSFHRIALDEGRHWEATVSEDLGKVVFDEIFPRLVQSMIRHDRQAPVGYPADYLDQVRQDVLIFLYRLLFLLYAEDRNLLPTHDQRYDDYSLRNTRDSIARRRDQNDVFSAVAGGYHNHLKDLFRFINEGETSIGMPPYNGGLFDDAPHPVLARATIPDAELAPLIDRLSRWEGNGERRWINYRDLSVRHLGSIYEHLLEFSVVADAASRVQIQPNIFARKGSGSYYTHDDLVSLLVERTLGPLVHERVAAFETQVETLGRKRSDKAQRLRELSTHDPAVAILDLKICDPAMGSGHFLVAAVDYLADQILEHMANAEAQVGWVDAERTYRSPLSDRIAGIRDRVLASARQHHWSLDSEQLDDRQIVRRLILKRVIFGVDKNPMAVELAKLALWLHTFTVGAPLSFLDHHLRCGDSLFGERVEEMLADLRQMGALFMEQEMTRIGVATDSMSQLTELTDSDIAEVHQSRHLFQEIDSELRPLQKMLDFWHARRWVIPPQRGRHQLNPYERGLAELLSGHFGPLFDVVSSGVVAAQSRDHEEAAWQARTLLNATRELCDEQHVFHWEIAFPTVWRGLANHQPQGGFDAIIGNPPWDRMKLQEVEWFAARRPEIALQTRAADRKRMIQQLETAGDPLWHDYLKASERAETAARVARDSGSYPLLSGGDINLYSLFVERASRLIAPNGLIGLLTPSGIAADLGASNFFKGIATAGRISTLFDFENRKIFFPDIHASFKFCALVFGGDARRFEEGCQCAFFLHAVDELREQERVFNLRAEDFAAVNPNTGTAPIFRRKRDAEITTAIYRRLPVLVDHRHNPSRKVWPVRYAGMFHMTNDSGLFKRRDELETAGFYPTGGSHWKKGDQEFLPLYEGKMVQMYDHRAANIVINPENLHRPAQPEPASEEQHADSSWLPEPQFWISGQSLELLDGLTWTVGFKDVTAPTNVRTMIAAVVPAYGFGNTLPVLLPERAQAVGQYNLYAPLLVANLNSMICDYLARQKVQGQHLNWFIVEQLPFLPATAYVRKIGDRNSCRFHPRAGPASDLHSRGHGALCARHGLYRRTFCVGRGRPQAPAGTAGCVVLPSLRP